MNITSQIDVLCHLLEVYYFSCSITGCLRRLATVKATSGEWIISNWLKLWILWNIFVFQVNLHVAYSNIAKQKQERPQTSVFSNFFDEHWKANLEGNEITLVYFLRISSHIVCKILCWNVHKYILNNFIPHIHQYWYENRISERF